MEDLRKQYELELYSSLVWSDMKQYWLAEGQTELTYEQRMLYLYTERKQFECLGMDLLTTEQKPSDLLKEKYADIIEAYLPEQQLEAALALFDSYPLFSYTRRQVPARSGRFCGEYFLQKFFMGFKEQAPFEQNENITAVLLRSGEEAPKQMLSGILSGKETDARTLRKAYVLAKGMVMSRDEELLHMLIEQVKNRKQKDAFREELMKALAEGTKDSLLLLFQTLAEEKMAKFRSVRRCVGAWTGLYTRKTYEQITDDILADIWRALSQEAYRKELLESAEPTAFYLGLWAEGCFDVDAAVELGLACMREGAGAKKLAAAYYAGVVEQRYFSTRLAEAALEQWSGKEEDNQLLAALFFSYLRTAEEGFSVGKELTDVWYENARSHVAPELLPPKGVLPLEKYFESEAQARKHFALLQELLPKLPKKKIRYDLQELPIGKVMLSRGEIAVRMLLTAYVLQDDALIDAVCPVLTELDCDCRDVCFDICCSSPNTQIQKKTLLDALSMERYKDFKDSAEAILRTDFDREKQAFRTLEFTQEELDGIAEAVSPYLREWLCL